MYQFMLRQESESVCKLVQTHSRVQSTCPHLNWSFPLNVFCVVGLTRGVTVYDTSLWTNHMEGKYRSVREVFKMKTSACRDDNSSRWEVGTTRLLY